MKRTPQAQPLFLMCEPRHFTVDYEINPWMHTAHPVNRPRAAREFGALVRLYTQLGARVEFIRPRQNLPDMVFTANGAVVRGGTALISNFRYLERRPETALFASWFRAHGFRVKRMPEGTRLEGQGEAFFTNGHMFAGYGFRANRAGHRVLEKTFHLPVVSLRLIDPRFYHLDISFCPLRDGAVLYYPGAYDGASRAKIKRCAARAIPVTRTEALSFVCNSVPMGHVLVTGGVPSAGTRRALRALGYAVRHTPLGEFKKSGGGARCLTLSLNS
ncbi:hypothetical protein HY478_00645 [Candidatus Uhrbacteria bacterium]|nr:hypothetical protein [Candidatus Uhrbacteria bacterium]